MRENTIILNDCMLELPLIESGFVDVTFTSPPYNRKRNDKYTHYDDNLENWFQWQCEVIDQLLRVTKKHVIYNIQANYYNRSDVYKIIGKYDKEIRDIIIWEKTNPMPASGTSITNAVEYFLILGDIPLKANKTYTKNILSTSVNSKMPKNHKAVMKQEVSDYFIETFTKQGDLILDPFMGTGTTALSCIKFDRKYLGIEKELEYYDITKTRIDNVKKGC